MLPRLSKPIRKVLVWQVAVTAAIAVVAAFLAGAQGAVSAAVGGAISLIAGLVSALVASGRAAKSAGGILVVALKAEAVKLGLALILLWLVLTNYDDAVSGITATRAACAARRISTSRWNAASAGGAASIRSRSCA